MSVPRDDDRKPRRPADEEEDYDYMEAEKVEDVVDAEHEEEDEYEEDEDYEEEDRWWDAYDPNTFLGRIIHLLCEEETAPHAHLGMLLVIVMIVAAVVALVG